MRDAELMSAFRAEVDSRDGIAQVFRNELMILNGQQVLDLMDTNNVDTSEEDQMGQA